MRQALRMATKWFSRRDGRAPHEEPNPFLPARSSLGRLRESWAKRKAGPEEYEQLRRMMQEWWDAGRTDGKTVLVVPLDVGGPRDRRRYDFAKSFRATPEEWGAMEQDNGLLMAFRLDATDEGLI